MEKWTTYWWTIDDVDSDLCGEEFFTELLNGTKTDHVTYVKDLFPNEHPKCLGRVSEAEAEMMGLDTY